MCLVDQRFTCLVIQGLFLSFSLKKKKKKKKKKKVSLLI